MHLVVTSGPGAIDRYSQRLAALMPEVATIEVDAGSKVAERFGDPWLSRAALRSWWRDQRFRRRLAALRAPVHLPHHHLGRYATALTAPYVMTVHDLIRYFDQSRAQPLISRPSARDRYYLRRDVEGYRNAEAVIAVSRATQRDLVTHLGLPEERVRVVYEGVDHGRFHPGGPPPVPYPYVLFVGSEHPRKDLATLLAAVRAVKDAGAAPDLRLVKVGAAGGPEDDFRARTLREVARLGLADSVVFTGHVTDAEVRAYYAGAACTVLPSLYEGFGLPVLEAMACGSPVIVSNAGALPEVAGAGGLVVEPRAVTALAAAIASLLTEPSRAAALRAAGLERAGAFSWERTARETRAVYEAVEATWRDTASAAGRAPAPAGADEARAG